MGILLAGVALHGAQVGFDVAHAMLRAALVLRPGDIFVPSPNRRPLALHSLHAGWRSRPAREAREPGPGF